MTPKLVILDLDGTVHRGGHPTKGAPETIRSLIEKGVIVRYLTNNSTVDPEAKAKELNQMGIPAEPNWISAPGPVAAQLLRERGLNRVYVVGEVALLTAMAKAGLVTVAVDSAADGDVDAVVVGLNRQFDYQILRAAGRAILAGAEFVATNTDQTFPVGAGMFDPGAGSLVAAVEAVAGQPPIVIGKPEPTMVNALLDAVGVAPEEALMVGDRADTDLEAGRRAGVPTWLVLTGVEQEPIQNQAGSPDLRGLLDLW